MRSETKQQLTGTVLALGEVFLILGKDGGVYCNDETEVCRPRSVGCRISTRRSWRMFPPSTSAFPRQHTREAGSERMVELGIMRI